MFYRLAVGGTPLCNFDYSGVAIFLVAYDNCTNQHDCLMDKDLSQSVEVEHKPNSCR